MEAWIKYKGAGTDHYCRFGREIPKIENKVDICKFFGVNKEKAKYIAGKLLSDSRVECKIHKSASDSVRKEADKIEEKIEEPVIEEKPKRKRTVKKVENV